MGQRFPIGARVMWKDDIEKYGVVTKHYATACEVKEWDSETGEYVYHHVQNYKLFNDD